MITYAAPSECEIACALETNDPDEYCAYFCANDSYNGCQYYSLTWGNDWGGDPIYSTNPEIWCTEVQTPQELCHNQCLYDNEDTYPSNIDTNCTDICNNSTDQTECENNAYTIIDGSANISFCSFLSSTSNELSITVDENFYLNSSTIYGSIQASDELNGISLYSIDNDEYSYDCNYYEESNYFYTFECNTPGQLEDGTYRYTVSAEDLSSNTDTSETVVIETDIEDNKDLISLWRFDQPFD